MNAAHIIEAARSRVGELCSAIFPAGKRQGQTWRVGNVQGEPGDSLSVALSGAKAGLWIDRATNEGGTLVDLVMVTQDVQYVEALQWISRTLAISIPVEAPRPVKYTPPDVTRITPLDPNGPVYQWLVEERKLDPESLERYRVRQDPGGRMAVLIHYWDGQPCLTKGWWLPSLGKDAKCFSNNDPLHTLFGKHYVTPNLVNGRLVITEGQWDAISLDSIGIPAVSIPSGVSNHSWIETDWEYLAHFHTIVLCFDADKPGSAAADIVATRLGRDRCLAVHLPMKDANDMLKAGRIEELRHAIETAQPILPETLVTADEYRGEVKQSLSQDPNDLGLPFFFPEIPFRIRPYESTLYTGYTGHGKSVLLQQLMCSLMATGQGICLASLEQHPRMTLATMLVQATADPEIASNGPRFDLAYDRLALAVTVYKVMRRTNPARLLELFEYAFARFGATQWVLDNVMCLAVDREDLTAQAQTADAFRSMVATLPIHLHLVAHPRKPQQGEIPKAPSPHEVRGAAEWADMAHNIVSVWRNMQKEQDRWQMKASNASEDDIIALDHAVPDGRIVWGKQRATGVLPSIPIWFNTEVKRFRMRPEDRDVPYIFI